MSFPFRRRRKKEKEKEKKEPLPSENLQAQVQQLTKKVDTLETYVNAVLDSFGLRKRVTAPERCLTHPNAQVRKIKTWEFQKRIYTEFECTADGEHWIEEVER